MSELSLWLTVLLAALISLLAAYFVIAPLLQPGKAAMLLEDDKLVELLGRKDATLQAIKDLEFDYRVGKVSQEDYQRLDQRLRRQAIGLMQQIEKVAPASASLDEELETLIAQFRQTVMTPAAVAGTNHVGTNLVGINVVETTASVPPAIPMAPVAETIRFCTQCGKPVDAGHNFCAHCGVAIVQPDPAQITPPLPPGSRSPV